MEREESTPVEERDTPVEEQDATQVTVDDVDVETGEAYPSAEGVTEEGLSDFPVDVEEPLAETTPLPLEGANEEQAANEPLPDTSPLPLDDSVETAVSTEGSAAQTSPVDPAPQQEMPQPSQPQVGAQDFGDPQQMWMGQGAAGSQPSQQWGQPAEAVPPHAWQMQPGPAPYQRSMIAAALLAFFLGIFGVHNFYLGHTSRGVVQLLLTVLSLGFLSFVPLVWSYVEAVLILTRSGSYAYDAEGVPLAN